MIKNWIRIFGPDLDPDVQTWPVFEIIKKPGPYLDPDRNPKCCHAEAKAVVLDPHQQYYTEIRLGTNL